MLTCDVATSMAVLAVLLTVAEPGPCKADDPAAAPMPGASKAKLLVLKLPESFRARHEAFHAEFVKAAKESGKVGDAARSMEKLATAHFAKAKDVFPPLGLLPALAAGKITPGMGGAVEIADKLRTGLPGIHREHAELVAGLQTLAAAAKEEGKTDYVRFAQRLTLHIQEEEEVLYPAVLLIGDCVKRGLDK